MTVGFPINPRDGTVPPNCQPPGITPDFWTLDIYENDDVSDFIGTYKGYTSTSILVFIKTTSLNQSVEDDQFQVDVFSSIMTYVCENLDGTFIEGMIMYEFSDEWWRSDLSTGGYDVEGCPNSNPYAHTACGITTIFGFFPLEYSGLFSLRDVPLGYCIIPKKLTNALLNLWAPGNSNYTEGMPICAGLTPVVPEILYPIVVGLSLLAIAALLVLPTPKPPKIIDKQLQYFADVDDEVDRTHLMPNSPSVNGLEPSHDSLATGIAKGSRPNNKQSERASLILKESKTNVHS